MAKNKNPNLLKKYTQIRFLEDILTNNRLHLANPESWEDKNDVKLIEHYRSQMGIKDIRILCMNESADRYHFWKIYGQERQGVCLWFDKTIFIENECNNLNYPKTICETVQYKNKEDLQGAPPPLSSLPFLKRAQYRDEKEFRIVRTYDESIKENDDFFEFNPASLKQIFINDWLNGKELAAIKSIVKSFPEHKNIVVKQNKTLGFQEWLNAAKNHST